jgi:hypothetical protein
MKISKPVNNILAQDAFLVVNKAITSEIGLDASFLLSYLLDQYNYYNKFNKLEDGFFFKTKPEIEIATTLSLHRQKSALKILTDMDLVEVYLKKCIQPKFFYKINEKKLNDFVFKLHSNAD